MSALVWIVTAVLILGGIAYLMADPAPIREPAQLRGTVRYVVDGDSLYMNGHEPQIRLWGVDAPERNERGYAEATATLIQLAKGKRVKCQEIDRDRYGRTVARCFLSDGREINRMMIESGTAQEYMRFSRGFYSGGN